MKSIRDIFRSYAEFNDDGKHINGTDKESNHHYGDAYESLFVSTVLQDFRITETQTEPVHVLVSTRNSVKLVMEIGIADGSCLRAWREVFPNALIVGMDIHGSDKAHGDRIEFNYGDLRNREHCETVAAGRSFDLIIDDATHHISDVLLTMFWMWPYVAPGGLYVVEDWDVASFDKNRICSLWPYVKIINTRSPFMQDEPLVVFRKPLR